MIYNHNVLSEDVLKIYLYITHDFRENTYSLVYKEAKSITEYVIKDKFLTSTHLMLFLINFIFNLTQTKLFKITEKKGDNPLNKDFPTYIIEFNKSLF